MFAVGVGQPGEHKQPSALVVMPQTTRPDFDMRSGIAQSCKFIGNSISRPRRIRTDVGRVFPKHESWANQGYHSNSLRSQAFRLTPMSEGIAVSLAGVSKGNDVNQSRIACGVPLIDECTDIAEDGRAVEGS